MFILLVQVLKKRKKETSTVPDAFLEKAKYVKPYEAVMKMHRAELVMKIIAFYLMTFLFYK